MLTVCCANRYIQSEIFKMYVALFYARQLSQCWAYNFCSSLLRCLMKRLSESLVHGYIYKSGLTMQIIIFFSAAQANLVNVNASFDSQVEIEL